ncbi:MAG: phosphoribosylformylglycinamidine synthase [Candidatus Tokpelaia sp. JSC085]|nr:MAG: phosphoribosylformylglycinamidine synthase [Candidatus Tokpelaia sp. JSC085]
MEARVIVTLKGGIFDPQGEAIAGALGDLGFYDVQSIRQGKVFDIVLEKGEHEKVQEQLEAMCEKLLANAVVENYQINLLS